MAGLILHPAVIELANMAHQGFDLEFNQLKITDDSPFANKTLAELELPRAAGAHVVAVRHADGRADFHPQSHTQIAAGDTLILMGENGLSQAVESLQTGMQS